MELSLIGTGTSANFAHIEELMTVLSLVAPVDVFIKQRQELEMAQLCESGKKKAQWKSERRNIKGGN